MPNKIISIVVVLIGIVTLGSQTTLAQSDPSAGILPFSTHVGGQYDSIDPHSGNILLTIPVMSKAGKMPFALNLVGNFHAFVAYANGTYYWWVPNHGGGG